MFLAETYLMHVTVRRILPSLIITAICFRTLYPVYRPAMNQTKQELAFPKMLVKLLSSRIFKWHFTTLLRKPPGVWESQNEALFGLLLVRHHRFRTVNVLPIQPLPTCRYIPSANQLYHSFSYSLHPRFSPLISTKRSVPEPSNHATNLTVHSHAQLYAPDRTLREIFAASCGSG